MLRDLRKSRGADNEANMYRNIIGSTFLATTRNALQKAPPRATITRTATWFAVKAAALSRPDDHEIATRPFTTAAPTTAKKLRPTRRRVAPITVTDRAAARIQELLSASPSATNAVGIRLGVKRRGCNGLSYTLNYVHSPSDYPADEVVHGPNGVTVFIDPMALFSIVGTTMDWVDTELSTEFTFENPNSKGECGCGESFTV